MVKRLYAVFVMNVASVVFTAVNLANPTWITVLGDTFGLITCQNCKPLNKNWSLECFSRYTCKHDYPNCDFYTSLYSSSTIFIILETIYIVFTLLLINRLLLIILNRAYGSYPVFLALQLISFSLQFAASVYYLASISIQTKEKISHESGWKLSIFILFFSFITSVLTFLATFNLPEADNYFCEDSMVCKLRKKALIATSTILLALGAYFNIVSLSGVYWTHEGTLFRCEYCREIPWMPWQCLAGYACEVNADSDNCKEFSNLAEAGRTYTIVSITSTIFIILVIDTNITCLASNIYGLFQLCFVYLGFSIVFQVSGVINWASATGNPVEFLCIDGDCKGNGPFFATLGFFFIVCGSVVFKASVPGVYSNNFEEVQKDEEYMDPGAICNTPVSCLNEDFDNGFPLSKSLSFLGVKLPSLEDFEHAHSTGF